MRSGKSVVMCWMIDFICRNTPNMIFLVGRKSFESLKTDTQLIFERNPGILQKKYGEFKDGKRQIDYYNGSRIYFRHFDKPEGLIGMTVGGIYFEQAEEVSEEDYKFVITRLSQWGGKNTTTANYLSNNKEAIATGKLLYPRNYLFLTANPKACWLKDFFINKQVDGFKNIHLTIFDN